MLYEVITDILTNLNFKKILDYHIQNRAFATLVVRQRSTSRYLLFNRQILVGWKNKKSGEIKVSQPEKIANADEFAFSGIHRITSYNVCYTKLLRPEMNAQAASDR